MALVTVPAFLKAVIGGVMCRRPPLHLGTGQQYRRWRAHGRRAVFRTFDTVCRLHDFGEKCEANKSGQRFDRQWSGL